MSNVIDFSTRQTSRTNVRREPIAKSGLRPSVEVIHDDEGAEWVIVEALVPRRRIGDVVPAIWAAVR
ncbi:hypothetical protein ACO2RV_14585 [Ancylobacter sp. VNQ12]|uniref:hypothetical protein n=1 Tax=Ancylobacter sp. VNQ12 TaxID=3400920 RepID=UPI003BFC1F2D